MGNRLEGKVAVVTGGGRGIGRGVALLMAEEGASVVVNDLGCDVDGSGSSREPADATAAKITSAGGKAAASYADTSTMDGAEALIKTAVDTFGGQVDVLVNSVGILRDRMIYQMTSEEFEQVIRNNVKGIFAPIKFAAILFRQQRSGRIVNMTSDAGLGDIGRSNYAAASEGIIGVTRTVARDLGRYGVTCNAISPMVETRLFPGTVDEFRVAQGPSPTPDERAGIGPSPAVQDWEGEGAQDDAENVAPLAVYLSTYAAPNINGFVFGVRRGSIYLYSNPAIERTLHKWGRFTMDEMDVLVPKMIGSGF
ncbi:MAG: SDR family NAD(P)-dependent oxidoreductase [Chloroflexi bacterium]|nr:SDR family NAD(P)-dependent oxidoreductase [Chloroflexota bacterium]